MRILLSSSPPHRLPPTTMTAESTLAESNLQASLTPQRASLRCPQSALLHDGPGHACRTPPNRILVLGVDDHHSRLRLKASAGLGVVRGPLLCPGLFRFVVRRSGRLVGW